MRPKAGSRQLTTNRTIALERDVSHGRIHLAGVVLLVASATAWVHQDALSASALSFDDEFFVTKNPLVQNPSWASARRFFSEVLTPSTVGGYYLPLSMTSLMVDYAMGGRPENLRVFHRTSLTLHVLNTVLIVILLYMLFKNPLIAALVGLLFGIHPLTVEPIVWVGERKTLLAAFFGFLAIIVYLRYVTLKRRGSAGGARTSGAGIWYGACFTCYALSVLSKPTSITLPVLLLLLDYWPLRRLNRATVVEKIPLLVLAGASAVVTLLSTAYNSEMSIPGRQSIATIPLRMCYLIVFYLRKMVWPGRLSSAYPIPEPMTLSHPTIMIAVLLAILLMAGLAFACRRTRAFLTGSLFFFIAILPTLGIVHYSWVIASDKYVYLPAFGVLMILAWLLSRLWSSRYERAGGTQLVRGLICAGALVIFVSEATAARRYMAVWKNTETLYKHMIEDPPRAQAWALHYTLGNLYLDQGRVSEAIPALRRASELNPGSVLAHNNLGLAFARQHRMEEAASSYRRALELQPGYAEARNNLGNILARQGRLDEARGEYRRALELKPGYLEAHLNLANVLAMQGQLDQAIAQLRQATSLTPDQPVLHCNLANLLATAMRYEEAVPHYQRALRLKPDYMEARRNLESVLAEQQHQASTRPVR